MFFVFLVLISFALCQSEQCFGKSDVLFVVDGSGSITCQSWCAFMDFCISIANSLSNVNADGVRMAMIQFSGQNYASAKIEFDFNGDRNSIVANFTYLRRGNCNNNCPGRIGDWTPFGYAMARAYSMFNTTARKSVQKFMFFFSDGDPAQNTPTGDGTFGSNNYCQTAACLRPKVVQLYTDFGVLSSAIKIGAGGTESMMKNTMSYMQCLYFSVPGYQAVYLNPLVTTIQKLTCLDVFSIVPSYGCAANQQILMQGTGFLKNVSHHSTCTNCIDTCSGFNMNCRVGNAVYTGTVLDGNTMLCPAKFNSTVPFGSKFKIDASLDNGRSWTDSVVSYEIVDCLNGTEPPQTSACLGVSDIIFVLDSSLSIDDLEWSQLRTFVYNLTLKLYLSPENVKVSIIEFTTDCNGLGKYSTTVFNLTGDRNTILRSARNLGRCGRAATPLHSGLKAAYNQIMTNSRSDAYKFVIVVTDGVSDSCRGFPVTGENVDCELPDAGGSSETYCSLFYNGCKSNNTYCYWDLMSSCCACDKVWKDKIQDQGAFIYGVSVGSLAAGDELDEKYVRERIATLPEYYANAASFASLGNLMDSIVFSTCIDIYSLSISSICYGKDISIRISGSGFTKSNRILARVSSSDHLFSRTFNVEFVDSWTVGLKVAFATNKDLLTYSGIYYIAISVGGNFWTREQSLSYETKNCISTVVVNTIPFLGIGLLVLLLIMLCLGLCILMSLILFGIKRKPAKSTKIELKVEQMAEPEPLPVPTEEPEPIPEPMLSAPSVKRSMYFVGGKAMSVDWGEKGMSWDSPFRGNNMGMGENFGHNQKNKLYDEIQKRKLERRKKMNEQGGTELKTVETTIPPPVDRMNKPVEM